MSNNFRDTRTNMNFPKIQKIKIPLNSQRHTNLILGNQTSSTYRKNVYCEWKFLENYISDENNAKLNSLNALTEDFQRRINLANFWYCIEKLLLVDRINLFFDISPEVFTDKYLLHINGIANLSKLTTFEKLIRKITVCALGEGNRHIKCLGDKFINVIKFTDKNTGGVYQIPDNKHLDAIYLTTQSKEVCQYVMQKWGVMAISPDNIECYLPLFMTKTINITPDREQTWDNILKCTSYFSNTLILFDNYILKSPNIKNNLKYILDSILPLDFSKNISFHILIVTCGVCDVNKVFQDVNKLLSDLRPKIHFRLSIYSSTTTSQYFHDRKIMTNNMIITTPNGFDMFSKVPPARPRHLTNLQIYNPYINNEIQTTIEDYVSWINEMNKYLNMNQQDNVTNNSNYYVGDKELRLLDSLE